MDYVEQVSVGFFIIGLVFILIVWILSKLNHNVPKMGKVRNPKFALLVPARDESMVIRGLLESIRKQTYPISMKDVYLIVESKEDPTVQIGKEYGVVIIVRQDLNLKGKGYALDEGIKYILNHNKQYDAYFIFDADNILDENYFYEMVKVFDMGYDVGSCYRNCKNGNETIISACSSIIFSFINTILNERKNKTEQNIITIGSGFYIRSEWIEKWGGFPFHMLAEDYEFSLYTILNEMTTYYNKNAIVYDEQPTTYKESVIQRIRWIRGYFDARKGYMIKLIKRLGVKPKNRGSIISTIFGVIPYIFMIVGLSLFLLYQSFILIVFSIYKRSFLKVAIFKLLLIFPFVYLILFLITLFVLVKERDRINLSNRMKCYSLFIHPFYLLTYIPCALKAILKKEVSWDKISHKHNEVIK